MQMLFDRSNWHMFITSMGRVTPGDPPPLTRQHIHTPFSSKHSKINDATKQSLLLILNLTQRLAKQDLSIKDLRVPTTDIQLLLDCSEAFEMKIG